MSKHSSHTGASGKEIPPGPEKEKAPENQAESSQNRFAKPPLGENSEKPDEEKSGPDASDQGAQKSPEDKIAELEAKLAEAEDRFLRKAADFENFRKRMNREKQEAIEYANQSLLLDLIQTMDDFERALKLAESVAAGEFSAFYEGISLIEKRLSSLLENKWGLKRYNSVGEPFDPNIHEAIQMEKSTEITESIVQEEYYKGYMLKDRVVRSAKVKVLMPDEVPARNEEAKPQGETG